MTLGGEHSLYYTHDRHRTVYLKQNNFTNQCHPNKFNKECTWNEI